MRAAAAIDLRDLTEKAWDGQLFAARTGLAPMLGWNLTYHTLRSKGSRSGFPDRVLVRERIVYVELKSETGLVSDAQREWLDGLAAAGAEAYVWRPSDLDEIGLILSKRWEWSRVFKHMLVPTLSAGLCNLAGDEWQPASLWIPGVGRSDTTEQQTLVG